MNSFCRGGITRKHSEFPQEYKTRPHLRCIVRSFPGFTLRLSLSPLLPLPSNLRTFAPASHLNRYGHPMLLGGPAYGSFETTAPQRRREDAPRNR